MPHPIAGGRGALRVLLAALLSAQLLIGLYHQHKPAATVPDCAACMLAAQLTGGVPPIEPPALPAPVRVEFTVATLPCAVPRTVLPPHTLPFSQAPPATA